MSDVLRTCADRDREDPARDDGLHDPRLWSNLRGAAERAEVTVAAHGLLECSDGMPIAAAWREGWTRHGALPALPTPALVLLLCAGAMALPRVIRRWRRGG